MRHHDYPMYDGGGSHVLGWLLLVLLVALLVGLIVAFALRLAESRRTHPAPALPGPAAKPGEDPLAVLRLRYASGEVDREAFLQAHADLGGSVPSGAGSAPG